MKTITTLNGYPELVIGEDCNSDFFYAAAEKLINGFEVAFISRVNDFDTLYWSFECRKSVFVLYYNIYCGVSIYPKSVTKSMDAEKQLLEYIALTW